MPNEIHELGELQGSIGRGAQLVEVLPEKEYEQEHLPGAMNISLKKMTADALAGLDRRRPIIVYCWDDV